MATDRAAATPDEQTNGASSTYVPRTPLGREIMELWKEVVASGQPLLDTWEDLEREIAERRGGLTETDDDS